MTESGNVTSGRPGNWPLALLALGFVLGAAATYALVPSDKAPGEPTDLPSVRIFAPWSMEKRLRRIFEEFQAKNPPARFHLVTGTPGSLSKRMRGGDVPDVYISMGPVGLQALQDEGIILAGQGNPILNQRMLLICSERMKGIVKSVEDLAKPEVTRVGIGRPSVSAGTYARQALERRGVREVVEAKSQISPLRSLLRGEVDAAIVLGECCYQEDLLAGRLVPLTGVTVVEHLPDELVPEFPIVAIATKGAEASEPARRFVSFLSGAEAQAILLRQGPQACPVCDGGVCPIPQ